MRRYVSQAVPKEQNERSLASTRCAKSDSGARCIVHRDGIECFRGDRGRGHAHVPRVGRRPWKAEHTRRRVERPSNWRLVRPLRTYRYVASLPVSGAGGAAMPRLGRAATMQMMKNSRTRMSVMMAGWVINSMRER